MKISIFASEKDSQPKTSECTWDELADELTQPTRSACVLATCEGSKCLGKRAAGAWSPATYATGTTRSKASVETVSALVLDLDHLADDVLADALDRLGDYQRLIHSSHSDRPGDRCVRVVLALSEPVAAHQWPTFWRAATMALGVPVDPATCDASRLYFVPTRPDDADYLFESHHGEVLNVAKILALAAFSSPPPALGNAGSVYGPASPALLQHARQRLQKHGPAIEGQGGNAHARAAWGIVVNDHALSETEARALACEWNATCEPPWKEEDLFAGPMRSGQRWNSQRGSERDLFEAGASLLAKNVLGLNAAPFTLPEIVISNDQQDITNQAERALGKLGGVYVRGRTLAHVVRDHSAPNWLRRPNGAPVIESLPRERLREMIGAAARWKRVNGRGEKVTAMVPPWVVETLLARGEWSFPVIEGVSDTPLVRSDGTIQEQPGYDAATRTIYDPCGAQFPPVPVAPSHADAARALDDLLEPFCDFPFVAPSDRAAVAAMLLSILARSAIEGCVPLFASGAPTPGSGKGLALDAISVIATGRAAPKMAPIESDDEMRKRLLALAIEAPSITVIDNVEGAIGSASLAMALTAGEISDRVLGSSKTITVSLRSVWALTGNNVVLRGDLGRRVVPIGIDPKVEHPEDRVKFRYPKLLHHVGVHRERLVVAALTILRGYFVAGCPSHGKPEKGSFESWDRTVRAAIIWAGGVDPLGGVDRIREQGDDDLESLRSLLGAWEAVLGNRDVFLDEVIAEMNKIPGLTDPVASERAGLRHALTSYASKSGRMDPATLSNALRKIKGRIADGLVLETRKKTKRGVPWCVVRTTSAGDAGDAGDADPQPSDLINSIQPGDQAPSPSSQPAESLVTDATQEGAFRSRDARRETESTALDPSSRVPEASGILRWRDVKRSWQGNKVDAGP